MESVMQDDLARSNARWLISDFGRFGIPVTTPCKIYPAVEFGDLVLLAIQQKRNCCVAIDLPRPTNRYAVRVRIPGFRTEHEGLTLPNVTDANAGHFDERYPKEPGTYCERPHGNHNRRNAKSVHLCRD